MAAASSTSPVPAAADDGRSRQRYRQAALTTAAGVLAKGAAFASTLVTIPITAPYLGPERFGLFMTVSAIPLLLVFTDFGIGNGLLSELSSAYGREDRSRVRVLVSSAFFMLTAITIVLLVAGTALVAVLPWDRILNLHSAIAKAEAMPSLVVFFVLTVLGVPVGVPQRVQQAEQRGFITNMWWFAGNLLTMISIVAVVKLGRGLPWLVGAMAGSTLLVGVVNWIVEFRGERQWLRPELRFFCRTEAAKVTKAGLMIFSSQVGASLLMTAPVILLGQIFGQDSVGEYSVMQRLLSIFVVGVSLLMTPLWPAYGESLARGDLAWIRTAFKRSLMVTFAVAGIPLACAWLVVPKAVTLFSSHTLHAGSGMAAGVAGLCFCIALRHTLSMMVNGCGYLRRTAAGFPAAVVLAASALLVPRGVLQPYMVPLWVAGAELIVIGVLLTDASRILAQHASRP